MEHDAPGAASPATDLTEFRLLAENLPSLCWIASSDGYIMWYNRRWHEYCGTNAADMEGWGWTSVHDPDVLPEVIRRWNISLAAGEPLEMTFPLRGADGIFRPFFTRIVPLKDAHGRVLRWFGNNVDISSQRRIEQALRESEERLQLALSAGSGVGIWDWDLRSDILVGDARFARFFGVAPERAAQGAASREFFRNVLPQDRKNLRHLVAEAIRTGRTFAAEYRLVQPDTTLRWIAAEGRCSHAPDGTPLRFPGVCFDVTDRKTAEEALGALNQTLEDRVAERTAQLQESENRLRAIFETTHQYQIFLDIEGHVQYANGVALRGIGAILGDIIGQIFWDTLWFTGTPGMSRLVHDAFLDVLQGGDVEREMQLQLPIGQRRFHFTMRPIRDRGGKMVAIVPEAVDITDRRHAEEALRQSQKMEAVGQLTGGIAHDFNNLLTVIGGSLELLQTHLRERRAGDPDRYIHAAQSAASRAAALTHRLLAFSRRQTLAPRSVDMNRVVGSMQDLILRTVGPEIQMAVIGAPDLWPTLVDPNQLENALLNLCINARDAMPDGGQITIETANQHLDAAAAARHDLPPGAYVSLCVTDTGTGMTPDILTRAFDPFFTTKPLGAGTGLGLSMIYGFARQSDGQAWIRSEFGRGTTVCLYLPRGGLALRADFPEPPPLLAEVQGAGHGVLVVDDEAALRNLITEMLHRLGYEIFAAATGHAALEILQSTPRIDIMITDIGLAGGMNGRQLAVPARQLRPDLKILFITGYAEHAVFGSDPAEAGMHVMTKPFAIETLARRVADILGE